MVNVEVIRTVVGALGNVISFGLFLSPLPTFVRIIKKNSVEQFKPHPYVMTVMNCMMWVVYGMPFVHPDSTLVITINGIGIAIELLYVTIFLIYSHSWPKRMKLLLFLVGEVIFTAVIVVITILCFHTTEKRSMFVGILCIVFTIGMYFSPLVVMKRVIRTRSVKYMPFLLSLANLCNGVVWSVYALLKFDPYILVPNGLGTLSGLVQIILFAVFYKTTNWDDTNIGSDIEIHNHDRQP